MASSTYDRDMQFVLKYLELRCAHAYMYGNKWKNTWDVAGRILWCTKGADVETMEGGRLDVESFSFF